MSDVGSAREHQAPLWNGVISDPNNLTAGLDTAGTPRRFLPRRTAPWRISQILGGRVIPHESRSLAIPIHIEGHDARV